MSKLYRHAFVMLEFNKYQSTLRNAYSNILKSLQLKKKKKKKKRKFSDKKSDIFHISAQNIDFGYS